MLRVLEPGDYFGENIPRHSGAGLSIVETDFASDLVIPRHEHVNAFFCFVLGGRATRAWPGRTGDEAPMSLTFFPAALPHENCWYGPGGHVLHVEFASSWLERLGGRADLLLYPGDFPGGAPLSLMRRLVYECRAPDAATPLAVEGLVLELLAACQRTNMRRSAYGHILPSPAATPVGAQGVTASPMAGGARTRRWLDRAEALLRERCCEPLSLAAIAADCNVSADHLARAFRKHFGCTVGEYVRQLRLDVASRLLLDVDRPLAQIAETTGFADQSHFTRVFRRQFGLTPGEYRALRAKGRFRSNS
jgi:AraC-like DNA-binding protein